MGKTRHAVRVLYVQPNESYAGAERQIALAVPSLMEAGIALTALCGSDEAATRWRPTRGRVDILVSRSFPAEVMRDRPLRHAGIYLRAQSAVSDEIEALVHEHEIDLVYASGPFAWWAATAGARRAGASVVWRAGESVGGALPRALLRMAARIYPPDLVLCCNEVVRRRVAPLVPAPAEIIHNGVELDVFRPGRAQSAIFRPPGAKFLVGLAGPLREGRGVFTFIEAAARSAHAMPEAHFVVAGAGPARAAAEAAVRACGLENRVKFLGFVADMQAYYAACDVVALPGRGVGCPNVLLEAMAMQRPIVASDEVAAGTVSAGKDALVTRAGDAQGLASALVQLHDNETLRASLSRQAVRTVREVYDARQMGRRLARALRMVAALSGLHVLPELRRELLAGIN